MSAEASKWMDNVGVGRMLGRYELLVPIAQGGMAIVWAARLKAARGFQKIVAVKSMLPSLSEDPQFEEMFLAEARLAARIQHPNVCEILDLGEDDGVLYIVMEWVDGESLSALQKAARSRRAPLPLGVSARIIRSAALGLHAAHELTDETGAHLGLVHRDVSPQNILVGHDGTVKIVDFGVAKANVVGAALTQAGQVKGKVPFMAPEQLLGKPLDRRVDVFALGLCLYQLVAGKHPFRAESVVETAENILCPHPVVPPSELVPDIPRGLDAVILRALAKDRDDRFATMAEMARALDALLPCLGGSEADVADAVEEMIGQQGKKRRTAIQDAQRLTDIRTDLLKSGIRSEAGVTAVSMLTIPLVSQLTPPAANHHRRDAADSSPESGTPTVALRSFAPAPLPSRSRVGVGAIAVALGASLVTAALLLPSQGPARSLAAEPVSGPRAAPVRSTSPGTDTAPADTASAAPPAHTTSPVASAPAAPEAPSASASQAPTQPSSQLPRAGSTAAPSAPPKPRTPLDHPGGKPTAAPLSTARFVHPDF